MRKDVLSLLEHGTAKLREHESRLVHVMVPVPASLELPDRGTQITPLSLCSDDESNLARRVGRNGGESVLGDREELASGLVQLVDEIEVDPQALALGADVSSRSKSIAEELEVGLLEQGLGGANGIRGIRNDAVKLGGVPLQVSKPITDVHRHALVGQETGHVRQVELGNADNGLIDIAEDDLLDGIVLEDLTDDSTIAATNNEDLLRVGVRSERDVRDHLLVAIKRSDFSSETIH